MKQKPLDKSYFSSPSKVFSVRLRTEESQELVYQFINWKKDFVKLYNFYDFAVKSNEI